MKMAGIGFELEKLFSKKGIFALARAYGYSGVICAGPMLLGMVLLMGVRMLAAWGGVDRAHQELLTCMITYTLLASLMVTNCLSMVTTRYVADALYDHEGGRVMPSFYGSTALLFVLGGLPYGIFLLFSGVAMPYQLCCLVLFMELVVVWMQISYLTAVKDFKGIMLTFLAAVGGALATGWILVALGKEPVLSLLLAVIVGYGMMMVWYYKLLIEYFPKGDTSAWQFLKWIDRYPQLVGTGMFVGIGLFAHLVIMWASPIGVQVSGLFYSAPGYDIPALFAFLSILITTIHFVTSVEVHFYPKYRIYFGLFNSGGTLIDIQRAEEEMTGTLFRELSYTFTKQFFASIVFIVGGTIVIPYLPFGFTEEMLGVYRVLCVGYAFYASGNYMMLLSLYFSDHAGALFSTFVYAVCSVAGTLFFRNMDTKYFGFGFVIGSAIFTAVAMLRLMMYLKRLRYHVISKQPLAVVRTKGVVARISRIFTIVMLALLVSGCSQSTEAQTLLPQVVLTNTDTGYINAHDSYEKIGNLEIRDNDTLYQQDNDLEIVTMYLTVQQGSASDNTDHTWEEVNEKSAYYYNELGIERDHVDGILKIGDENGPLPGAFGYDDLTPNVTVCIRGQTSTRSRQKNYRIKIKDGKGSYKDQTVINLNKHVADAMRFRNKLCYDLMEELPGMMSARTQFVHLYVRDLTKGDNSAAYQDYGLYTQVEQINKRYLRNHGLDKNGQLYKINFFEFYRYEDVIMLNSDPAYDRAKFERYLEIKGNEDHRKLIEMLDDLNDTSIPIETTFAKWFDEENVFSWLAFHILVGNKDTEARNCFLYSPQNVDKWYLISWDNDASFKSYERSLSGWQDGGGWMTGVSNYWGSVLFRRILKSNVYREKLDEKINEYRAFLTTERLQEMAQAYDLVVGEYVQRMPDIQYLSATLGQRSEIIAQFPHEVEENYEQYLKSLENPQPFYVGTPELTPEGLTIFWDIAYDFQKQDITYTVELARNYLFENPVYREEGIHFPKITIREEMEPGNYFVRVMATDSDGNSQYAFDSYISDRGKEYGVKSFYIMEDGSVVEDEYAER